MTEAQAAQVRSWTLLFTGYPANDNLRRTMHFHVRSDHDQQWHAQVLCAVIDARVRKPLKRIRVSAVFTRRALGVADEDNDRARLKPVIDGLVHAGVVPKDNRRYVELGSCTEEHGVRGFRLTIEDLSDQVPL